MIAGVVATLTDDAERLKSTFEEFASRIEIELGEHQANSRRIPLTIDAVDRSDMTDLTDWLRSRAGVAFVDVVFVHLEEQGKAVDNSADDNLPVEAR